MKSSHSILTLFLAIFCFSCSSDDEPEFGSVVNPTGDVTEWSLEMNLPDVPKTRAASSLSKGTDGLYTFPVRDINKLWYAVYYNDEWIYDVTTDEAPQPEIKGDSFHLNFKLPKIYDPSKIKIFFWAGAKDDKVTVDYTKIKVDDGINLNFKERCVALSPKYLNGDNTSIVEYDSFCGYFQLSTTTVPKDYSPKFTLKRPFAQIHVLSHLDDGDKATFSDGLVVVPGFGRNQINESNSNISTDLVTPTTWFYDNSKTINPSYKKDEYIFSQTNYEHKNSLQSTWPDKTTFKGRELYYLACYLTFAPADGIVKGATASGNTSKYSLLNVTLRNYGDNINKSESNEHPIVIPSDGIKTNNRYIIYTTNKITKTQQYTFEIILDSPWESTTSSSK